MSAKDQIKEKVALLIAGVLSQGEVLLLTVPINRTLDKRRVNMCIKANSLAYSQLTRNVAKNVASADEFYLSGSATTMRRREAARKARAEERFLLDGIEMGLEDDHDAYNVDMKELHINKDRHTEGFLNAQKEAIMNQPETGAKQLVNAQIILKEDIQNMFTMQRRSEAFLFQNAQQTGSLLHNETYYRLTKEAVDIHMRSMAQQQEIFINTMISTTNAVAAHLDEKKKKKNKQEDYDKKLVVLMEEQANRNRYEVGLMTRRQNHNREDYMKNRCAMMQDPEVDKVGVVLCIRADFVSTHPTLGKRKLLQTDVSREVMMLWDSRLSLDTQEFAIWHDFASNSLLVEMDPREIMEASIRCMNVVKDAAFSDGAFNELLTQLCDKRRKVSMLAKKPNPMFTVKRFGAKKMVTMEDVIDDDDDTVNKKTKMDELD